MCPETGPLAVRRLNVSTGDVNTIPLGISATIEKTPSGHIERNVFLHVAAADPNSLWLAVANQRWVRNRTVGHWGGSLIRMDLSAGRVRAINIGGYYPGGVIADGDLWIADSLHHSVLRVEP